MQSNGNELLQTCFVSRIQDSDERGSNQTEKIGV